MTFTNNGTIFIPEEKPSPNLVNIDTSYLYKNYKGKFEVEISNQLKPNWLNLITNHVAETEKTVINIMEPFIPTSIYNKIIDVQTIKETIENKREYGNTENLLDSDLIPAFALYFSSNGTTDYWVETGVEFGFDISTSNSVGSSTSKGLLGNLFYNPLDFILTSNTYFILTGTTNPQGDDTFIQCNINYGASFANYDTNGEAEAGAAISITTGDTDGQPGVCKLKLASIIEYQLMGAG